MSRSTDPMQDRGAWEDGRVGAAIGKVMYDVYEYCKDWSDFVKHYTHNTLEEMDKDSKWKPYNIAVWQGNAEYYFINCAYMSTSEFSWWGNRRSFTTAVFESGYILPYYPDGIDVAYRGWLAPSASTTLNVTIFAPRYQANSADFLWDACQERGANIEAVRARAYLNGWALEHGYFGDKGPFYEYCEWPSPPEWQSRRGDIKDDSGRLFDDKASGPPPTTLEDAPEPKKVVIQLDAETALSKGFPNGSKGGNVVPDGAVLTKTSSSSKNSGSEE